jgi:2-keto-4-pentenoate hydratase
MLSPSQVAEAAALFVKAHRAGEPITALPETCRPTTLADGYAIQEAVAAALGATIGGYKAIALAGSEPMRGPLYASMIRPTPARYPAAAVRPCGVEGEVAFRYTRDYPPQATDYTREEVAAGLHACAAIEVVGIRFSDPSKISAFERLADNFLNGAFVHAEPRADWRQLDLKNLHVQLEVNGTVVDEHDGGHPMGDPLEVAVVLVNMLRAGPGVTAGQYVTCGSYTGVRFLNPGDVCTVRFAGLGEAQVAIDP